MTLEALTRMGAALANHVLQSTVFAGAAWLISSRLRNNPAWVRHAVWMAASSKFLVPIALLSALGSHIPWPAGSALVAPRQVTVALLGFSQPFAWTAHAEVSYPGAGFPHHWASLMPVIVLVLWLAGFAMVLMGCVIRWRRIAAALRSAERLEAGREIDALLRVRKAMGIRSDVHVRLSEGSFEPGVFGILRPVLMLPTRISERLPGSQLEAIAAHELCHVARRDNLTAVVHMASKLSSGSIRWCGGSDRGSSRSENAPATKKLLASVAIRRSMPRPF
jgi:bla regulator protein BlaR1